MKVMKEYTNKESQLIRSLFKNFVNPGITIYKIKKMKVIITKTTIKRKKKQ